MLNNKVYDILKYVAILALPALAVFYETIGGVWGLPYIEEITSTLNAVGLLIGTLITISTIKYNKEQ